MARLAILTTVPPERDPRAVRAAAAAAPVGLDVVHVHASPRERSPALAALAARPTAGLAAELRGLMRLARLALVTARLLARGRSLHADIVHANDLDTLPAGYLLARRNRARLVYDAHELYSGFERNPPRLWHWLSLRLEGALAGRADAVVTVSEPIAAELTRRLRLRRPPVVVLNCPPLESVEVEPRPGAPVRAIYQAAAGPGRLLGDVVDAAQTAPEVDVTVRLLGGDGRPLPGVRVEPPVAPDALVPALAPYDVGLVIDRLETENTRLALPNKLFEYLMAGLAVAVPRAPAMAELVEAHGVGVVYEPGRLGDALHQLAADREALDEIRRRARELAVSRFNAEFQRPALFRAWGL
jgi:glycogen synthase